MMRSRHTFLLLAAALAMSGCGVILEEVTVPSELIGIWGTTDERYVGRTFEFTIGSVIFQTGDGPFDFTAHPIQEISIQQVGDRIDYEIEYGTIEAGSFVFSFSHLPQNEGLIRFPNQPLMIWRQVEPNPAWY